MLDDYLNSIEANGKAGWLSLYYAQLGRPLTQPERLFILIDTYGKWPVIDAIMAAGRKKWKTTDDPLPYIYAVASAKWKEHYYSEKEDARYRRSLERSKRLAEERNQELEKKIERARKRNG